MRKRALPSLTVAVLVHGALLAPASAQLTEVELDKSAAADLYIRKRPPVPEAPAIPPELNDLLLEKEARADAKRKQAIRLLREFLDSKPEGDGRAEGLFKLAELLWEEARRRFVDKMDDFERALEACRQKSASCLAPPKEPRLDFGESEKLYKIILRDHPRFRRTDLVLYLVGFSAKEAGRNEESLGFFNQVIERFPESPLYPDSWMMIGEFYFAKANWQQARASFARVLDNPDAPTFDLALFKTAWCDWKLGDTELAAKRFKLVLDLAVEAERSSSARLRKRRAQLRDEALDYMVIVFTEDESISAKEVFEFLSGIGGERYSSDVLTRVADSYFGQSEYERAVNTYEFLIDLRPKSIAAAAHQRRIVEAHAAAVDQPRLVTATATLVSRYGPGSKWAEVNKGKAGLKRSLSLSERLARTTGKDLHAGAQLREKKTGKLDLVPYKRAAETYGAYLERFGKSKHAAEVRFLRAEILYFKLKQYEEAGDSYLAVGKSAPVGKYHKDALLKAMAAFEQARPEDLGDKRELLPVDRKFAASVDLYATLFPADPDLVGVIFRNGQLFYDYGDYDEAVKRFGLIVTKYPDDPNAGPAGDRILGALRKAEDYENIEDWARKLKQAKSFRSNEQQQRLDRLIVESINKSAERYASGGKYTRAAKFFLRVYKEFPNHELAPKALFNAAVVLEKDKRPEEAGETYLAMAKQFPKHGDSPKAAFTAAQVYEGMAYFERAATAYEVVTSSYPEGKFGADALFNAGLLRQALGQYRRAIAHYQQYAKRFKQREDAEEVAFNIAVVYEESGNDGRADRAFRDYAREYAGRGSHVIEAHTRAGRAALRLGQSNRAKKQFQTALKLYKKSKGKRKLAARKWAAEARYHQGELVYRDYEGVSLDVKPRKLKRTLARKTKLLDSAQSVYLDVVEYGDLQRATAALYRIGQVYEVFAESLRGAPTPPGLTKQEAELYRSELENYVVEIEEKAIELYAMGYQRAIGLKVYNRHTRMIREALGRLSASRFPPENEVRARVEIGDRPPELPLVKEVVRD